MYFQSLVHTLHVSKRKNEKTQLTSTVLLYFPQLFVLNGLEKPLWRYVVNLFTFLLIYFSFYFSNVFVSISKPFQSLTSHFKIPNTVCLASFLRIPFSHFSERILIFLFFLLRHDFVYSPFLCNYESNGNETERVYFVCVGQLYFQQRYFKN